MDKFGIFKLLNSFLNFCQQNKGDLAQNSVQNKEQLNLTNLVSSLTKNGLDSGKVEDKTPPSNTALKQTNPLQQSMIYTMANHEEFVKRVKEKNKTTF